MKVLISAGKKTDNIVKPLKERFSSGAVTISQENYIEGINNYIHRGEVFDRAIIVEPAIMGDFGSSEYESGRSKIITMLEYVNGSNNSRAQFVFVVTNTDLANILSEELFQLGPDRVKIIVLNAKFKLKFFIELCTLELSELKDVYESISTVKTATTAINVVGDTSNQFNDNNQFGDNNFGGQVEDVEPVEIVNTGVVDIPLPPEAENEFADIENDYNNLPETFESVDEVTEDTVEDNGFGNADGFDMLNDGLTTFDESQFTEETPAEENNTEEVDTSSTNGDAFGMSGQFDGVYADPELGEDNTPGYLPMQNTEGNGGLTTFEETDNSFEEEVDEGGMTTFTESDDIQFPEEVAEEDSIPPIDFGEETPAEEVDNSFEEVVDTETDFVDSEDELETPVEEENNNTISMNPFAVNEEEQQDNSFVESVEEENNVVGGGSEPESSGEYFGGMYNDNEDDSILKHMNDADIQVLQQLLAGAANRRLNLVFTGSEGSGKTTMAYNIAMLMAKLGYATLYVDCDTETRGAAYLDYKVYDWVHTDDDTVSSFAHAMGNSANIIAYAGVISPGLHVLTMGLDQDLKPMDKVGTINREKIHRFASMAKQNYNFVIYDVPFRILHDSACDLAYTADKLMYMTDCSTRGLMKMMLDIADIEEDDLRQLFIKKTLIVLNKYYKNVKMFGKDTLSSSKLLRELDGVIYEIVGGEVADRFETMTILQSLPLYPDIDSYWMTKKTFVETDAGLKMIGGFLKNILEA